jgi:hypothetical protein
MREARHIQRFRNAVDRNGTELVDSDGNEAIVEAVRDEDDSEYSSVTGSTHHLTLLFKPVEEPFSDEFTLRIPGYPNLSVSVEESVIKLFSSLGMADSAQGIGIILVFFGVLCLLCILWGRDKPQATEKTTYAPELNPNPSPPRLVKKANPPPYQSISGAMYPRKITNEMMLADPAGVLRVQINFLDQTLSAEPDFNWPESEDPTAYQRELKAEREYLTTRAHHVSEIKTFQQCDQAIETVMQQVDAQWGQDTDQFPAGEFSPHQALICKLLLELRALKDWRSSLLASLMANADDWDQLNFRVELNRLKARESFLNTVSLRREFTAILHEERDYVRTAICSLQELLARAKKQKEDFVKAQVIRIEQDIEKEVGVNLAAEHLKKKYPEHEKLIQRRKQRAIDALREEES